MDIIGNVILTQNYISVEGSNDAQLDLSKAAKGLYFLRIEKENAESKVIRIEVN